MARHIWHILANAHHDHDHLISVVEHCADTCFPYRIALSTAVIIIDLKWIHSFAKNGNCLNSFTK